MKYGAVKHLDKPVSRIVMGVIPLMAKSDEEAFELLDAYRAAGGNCIDNSYGYGERAGALMRAYYAARGEHALIRLDKGNHHSADGDEGRRVTKADLDHDLRGNLERQGTSSSDIYLLHRDDRRVPAGQVVEWLNEHLEAGRIRAFGGSNWHHTRVAEANEYADAHGLQGFSASSPNLSLAIANEAMWWEALSISDDPEARAWYADSHVAVLSWSSGGGGFYAGVESPDVKRVYENATNRERKGRVDQLAAELGRTPTQVALAWTLSQRGNIFALIGPASIDQLEDNLGAVDVELAPAQAKWLEDGEGTT